MSLSEKEVLDRLEGLDLPPSINEALLSGLVGRKGKQGAARGDHTPGV